MASKNDQTEKPFAALMAAESPRKAESQRMAESPRKAESQRMARPSPTYRKKPRGRPPVGAVWQDGRYILLPESVELAAQKLERHRRAARDRYRATREALRAAKPELFNKHVGSGARGSLPLSQFSVCSAVQEGTREEGHTGTPEGR